MLLILFVAVTTDAEDAEDLTATDDSEAEEESEPATEFGPGDWVVGVDIEPGRYRSSGDGGDCYIERVNGFSGDFDDIITNDLPEGQAVVEIAESDEGFRSNGCGDWASG